MGKLDENFNFFESLRIANKENVKKREMESTYAVLGCAGIIYAITGIARITSDENYINTVFIIGMVIVITTVIIGGVRVIYESTKSNKENAIILKYAESLKTSNIYTNIELLKQGEKIEDHFFCVENLNYSKKTMIFIDEYGKENIIKQLEKQNLKKEKIIDIIVLNSEETKKYIAKRKEKYK